MRARLGFVVLGFAGAVCVCSCGARPESPPPATPAGAPAEQAPGGEGAEKKELEAPATKTAPEATESQTQAPSAALTRARGDFDRAERELRASAGDCAMACRALGSMERAAAHLCELASSPADRTRCDEAKQKVLSARARVRNTCGSCSGGPSLDRDAPIPSAGSGP